MHSYNISKKHRRNLVKTALFMLRHKSKLNMRGYVTDEDGYCHFKYDTVEPQRYNINECGNTCCFAGFGPFALKNVSETTDINWIQYCKSTYGVGVGTDKECHLYDFLFGGSWADSKRDTAARLLAFLDGKLNDDKIKNHLYERKFYTRMNKTQLMEKLVEWEQFLGK